MIAPAVRDALVIYRSNGVVESVRMRSAKAHRSTAHTVEDEAEVVRCRRLLARKVKATVATVVFVYQHDLFAVLDGRSQLQLMACAEQQGARESNKRCKRCDLNKPARSAST